MAANFGNGAKETPLILILLESRNGSFFKNGNSLKGIQDKNSVA